MSKILLPIFVESDEESQQLRAGFIDAAGSVIVQPIFDCAGPFREGFAPVQIGGKWGFVNSSGHLCIEPMSGGQAEFFENKAVFTDPGTALCGVIDTNGQIIVKASYFRIGRFSRGVAWMSNVGAWKLQPKSYGVLAADGLVKVPFSFDDMRDFRQEVAAAELDGKWGFITAEGNFQIPPRFDAATCFSEHLARVREKALWGFVDIHGQYVIGPNYENALDFSEGLAAVQVGSLWGFINAQGETVISPSWRRVGRFSDGRAQVEKRGRIGYIDATGTQIIENRFSLAQDFRLGRALVETTSEIGYIDLNGDFVWSGPHLDISFAYL